MKAKGIVSILAGLLLLTLLGCEHIREPWVSSPNKLKQERARPMAVQVELRHRFLAVQTDR